MDPIFVSSCHLHEKIANSNHPPAPSTVHSRNISTHDTDYTVLVLLPAMLLPPSSRPMLDLMIVVTTALALPAPLPLTLTLDKPDDEPGRLVPGSCIPDGGGSGPNPSRYAKGVADTPTDALADTPVGTPVVTLPVLSVRDMVGSEVPGSLGAVVSMLL